MSLLPPVGWADVATNRDLDVLADRLEVRIDVKIEALAARVDAQIEALQASTAAQIANSRLATEKAMAELEAHLHRDMLRQTWTVIGSFVAIAGVLTANNLL